jgi:hypothetical protein
VSTKSLSAPWLIRLNWDEFFFLLICVGLDVVEYIIPVLLVPLAGDILDFSGFIFSVFYFGWIGFVSLIELIPSLDILPSFIITWLIWYILKKRRDKIKVLEELEKWK